MPLARFDRIDPERRARLLSAAAQEFAAEGFERASLGRIAEGAGVSKPSLYYYFEDKADLYATVVRAAWDRLMPGPRFEMDSLDETTFWPTLEHMRDENLARCREEPWLVAVGKLAYHPPREAQAAGAVAEMFEAARTFLRDLLRRGQKIGTVRRDIPEDLLIEMLTAADAAADHWMVDHWEELGADEADRIARAIFSAIRALLAPRVEGAS